jgi:adenylosuccinate synthase
MPILTPENLQRQQNELYLDPTRGIEEDYKQVYLLGNTNVGWPLGARRLYESIAREYTGAFIGLMFGDEGKGRFVDNKIGELLRIPGMKAVYVVRFQGGSNAGHTLQLGDQRFAVHQLPSGILYPEAVGVMDKGMTIHPENLKVEIEDIEERVGDLRGKLILSEEAILCTDLERAEEVFNRVISGGRSDGGTSMGISPSYVGFYDRTGLQIKDFFREQNEKGETWKQQLEKRYDFYEKYFRAFGQELSEITVPDLRATRKNKIATPRKVGTKAEFIARCEDVRTWFLQRDNGMGERKLVQHTLLLHQQILRDLSVGIVIEGSQGVGLHPYLGCRPDVTTSDTTMHGVIAGTGIYRPQDIQERIGVFKFTYTSKVPDRNMPTQIALPDDFPKSLPPGENINVFLQAYIDSHISMLSPHQLHAIWIMMYANEKGTTTGRFRGIHYLDLEIARYNARMGGIEMLGATHLDVARLLPDGTPEPFYVCTHYTLDGKYVPYRPGLEYVKGIKPIYIELPGWDGEAVQRAKSFAELPENLQKALAFIQRRIGVPIVLGTTGPERSNYLEIPQY